MPTGHYDRRSLEDRFWSRVKKTATCWLWTGNSIATGGYGYISYKRKMIRAHRLSYEWAVGLIPSGMFICHKCDNRLCVKPDHLFLGTPKDNIMDMHNKGRALKAVGSKAAKSRLTADQVFEIRATFSLLNISFAEMGRRYGVKHSAIIQIIRRTSWRHI